MNVASSQHIPHTAMDSPFIAHGGCLLRGAGNSDWHTGLQWQEPRSDGFGVDRGEEETVLQAASTNKLLSACARCGIDARCCRDSMLTLGLLFVRNLLGISTKPTPYSPRHVWSIPAKARKQGTGRYMETAEQLILLTAIRKLTCENQTLISTKARSPRDVESIHEMQTSFRLWLGYNVAVSILHWRLRIRHTTYPPDRRRYLMVVLHPIRLPCFRRKLGMLRK